MANIFEKIRDALNTPIPGTGKKAAPPPPAATTANSAGQQKAIDLQAELRRRAQELQRAATAPDSTAVRQQLEAKQAEADALRRELEKHMAQEAQAHATESAYTYTVVRGDTLSGIARRMYGRAALWPKIHEANKDKIKNPNLIYPGQVFVIPEKN